MNDLYSFGPFFLDPETTRLKRGDEVLRLGSKPAQVLRILLERSHQLVSYGEIWQLVWDTPEPDAHGLHVTVNAIRIALGEYGKLVENQPKLGFRFLHPDFAAAAHGSTTIQIASTGFRDLTLKPGDEYLGALRIEIETRMSTVEGLKMFSVAPNALHRIESLTKTPHYVLDGSMSGNARQLRIYVRLQQGDESVWGYTCKASAEELPNVASRLASQIAHAAKKATNVTSLVPKSSENAGWAVSRFSRVGDAPKKTKKLNEPTSAPLVTVDTNTYQLYLRGLHHWSRPTERNLLRALDYFRQAGSHGDYAPAFGGVARAYGLLALGGFLPPSEALPASRAAAMRCLEVDAQSAEGLTALGAFEAYGNWNWRRAEDLLKQAISVNGHYETAHHVYAMACLMPQGSLTDALTEIRIAESLNPVSPFLVTCVGIVHYYSRAYEDAISQLDTALELLPEYHLALWHRAWALCALGRFDDAIEDATKAAKLSDHAIQVVSSLAQVYAAGGRLSETRALELRLNAIAQTRYVCPYHLALIKTALGELDAAMMLLREAADQRVPALTRLNVQPILDPLRQNDDFRRLVKEMNLK
jgi:DNA-binding winged helix-turn-helix (wHTH) protein/tetratricopeptide (TPR) repeat protein